MKFGVVIKSTTVNRFVVHTLQRNNTHLAAITRKTNIKLGILKMGGGTRKEPKITCYASDYFFSSRFFAAIAQSSETIFRISWISKHMKNISELFAF